MKADFDVFSVAFSLPFALLEAVKVAVDVSVSVFTLPPVLREADVPVADGVL